MRDLLIAFSLLATATPVSAALGGDVASGEADRVHIQGALTNIVRTDRYTLHEMRSSTGTTIREYVSPDGKVFAVSWKGPFLPDLRQVLGDYFAEYQTEARRVREGRRARGPLAIDTGDLTVVVSGHTRAFTGRAIANRLMPAGFDKNTIQ